MKNFGYLDNTKGANQFYFGICPILLGDRFTQCFTKDSSANESVPDTYSLIGWMLWNSSDHTNGKIFETREESGKAGIPIYIKAEPAEVQPEPPAVDPLADMQEQLNICREMIMLLNRRLIENEAFTQRLLRHEIANPRD